MSQLADSSLLRVWDQTRDTPVPPCAVGRPSSVRARTAVILAHLCSFGLRPAFPPFFRCCHCCHFVSGRWPETCRFPAVLRLEPLTFNPSVLGSNPRGPTTLSSFGVLDAWRMAGCSSSRSGKRCK